MEVTAKLYQIIKILGNKKLISPTRVLIFVFFLLSLQLIYFIYLKSVNILFWDQWDFYNAFFQNKNLIEIFRWQHGPHRQGLAFIIDKYLAEVTHWDTKIESFFIGFIIIFACITAIFLKKRLFKKIEYTDIVIPLIFLTLTQYEIFIITPNPSHGAFPLLLLILYTYSWLFTNSFLKYTFITIINILLIYSGFGLFIGIITPVLLAISTINNKNLWTRFLLVITNFVSILSFASFFIGYSFIPAVDCFRFPHSKPLEYFSFISLMFSNFINANYLPFIKYIFGSIILLLALISVIKHTQYIFNTKIKENTLNIVFVILICFSLLFAINTAIGRVCLGNEAAHASRYVTYIIPAFFGLYLYLLTFKNLKIKKISLWIFILFSLIGYFSSFLRPGINIHSNGKKLWKECYLSYEDIALCNKKTKFQIYPDPKTTHLQEKLIYLKNKKLNLFK